MDCLDPYGHPAAIIISESCQACAVCVWMAHNGAHITAEETGAIINCFASKIRGNACTTVTRHPAPLAVPTYSDVARRPPLPLSLVFAQPAASWVGAIPRALDSEARLPPSADMCHNTKPR